MINLFDSKGKKIPPRASKKFPVGKDIKVGMKKYNANIAIPFSNLHQYQRRDSFWANEYVTPISLMSHGFVNNTKEKLLPAFQEIKFRDGELFSRNINPDKINIYEPVHESQFGDNWQDVLNNKQVKDCEDYFRSISNLFKNYQSIFLNVGGNSHEMLSKGFGKAKIIFKVPKTSLLKAIRQEIFDDLLIGNFMETQIIRAKSLYSPDFTFTVAKYSDNGRVQEPKELLKYFNYYNHRRSLSDRIYLYFFSFRKKILENLDINLITKLKYLLRK